MLREEIGREYASSVSRVCLESSPHHHPLSKVLGLCEPTSDRSESRSPANEPLRAPDSLLAVACPNGLVAPRLATWGDDWNSRPTDYDCHLACRARSTQRHLSAPQQRTRPPKLRGRIHVLPLIPDGSRHSHDTVAFAANHISKLGPVHMPNISNVKSHLRMRLTYGQVGHEDLTLP